MVALLHTLVNLCLLLSSPASAFVPLRSPAPSVVISAAVSEDASSAFTIPPAGRLNDKDLFFNSLDDLSTLNQATKERSSLLKTMIENTSIVGSSDELGNNHQEKETSAAKSIDKPGSLSSFLPVAPGTWRVVYAPHMTTMANLAGGSFQVEYDLNKDGTMESHAKYDFPIVGRGYLSVSGTFSSADDTHCRVDFDEAWIRSIGDGSVTGGTESNVDTIRKPYATIDEVPDSIGKTIIRKLGRLFFFDAVSVFPVSFLDDNLIVFDFELLGTRITAMKG